MGRQKPTRRDEVKGNRRLKGELHEKQQEIEKTKADLSQTDAALSRTNAGTDIDSLAIARRHVQANAVSSAELGPLAVRRTHVNADAVDGTGLAPLSVAQRHINANSVGSAELQNGSVGRGHIRYPTNNDYGVARPIVSEMVSDSSVGPRILDLTYLDDRYARRIHGHG